jgi:hypothetical protein
MTHFSSSSHYLLCCEPQGNTDYCGFLLPAEEEESFQGGVYSAYSTLWKLEDDEGREQKDH